MKKMNRAISVTLAGIMIAACLAALAGCGKNKYVETPETNVLYTYDEIRELNGYSKIPFLLGSTSEELGSDFEYVRGAKGHSETWRSQKNKDVVCTLSTIEYYYKDSPQADKLYATAIRISAEDKEIKKDKDGSTYAVYKTSRNVLGIKVGDKIEEAEKILDSYGYKNVYRETPNSKLPQSLEYTYQKGIINFTLAVESDSYDISQIFVWLPYNTEAIEAFNAECKLPAGLGSSYHVYANPDFKYDSKDSTTRTYVSSDGSVAKLRGFPDITDMGMSAYVSFTSPNYNALGITVGTKLEDAASQLKAKGWAAQSDGSYIKDIFVISFVESESEAGTIGTIIVSLAESTNLTGADISR